MLKRKLLMILSFVFALNLFLFAQEQIVSKEVHDSQILNNEGVKLYNDKNYNEALSKFLEAIKLNPNLTEAYKNAAATNKELGKIDDAIKILTEGVTKNPDYKEGYYELGKLYKEEKKNYPLAIENLLKADNTWLKFYHLGEAYENMNQKEKAINAYDSALGLKPDEQNLAIINKNVAKLYEDTKQIPLAINAYEKYIEIKPNDYNVLIKIGDLYKQTKKDDKALEYYLKAEEKISDNNLLYNLAIREYTIYKDKNDVPKQKESLIKALKYKPTDETIAFNLANLHIKSKEYSEAKKLLLKLKTSKKFGQQAEKQLKWIESQGK